jgi:hypothetical protein
VHSPDTHTCTSLGTTPSLTALCCPQFGGLDAGAFWGLLLCGFLSLIVSCSTGGVACCCAGEDDQPAMQAAPPAAAVPVAKVIGVAPAPSVVTLEERLAGMDMAACRMEIEREDLKDGQAELIQQRIKQLDAP